MGNLGTGKLSEEDVQIWAANFGHYLLLLDELVISTHDSRAIRYRQLEQNALLVPTQAELISKTLQIFGMLPQIQASLDVKYNLY